MKTSALAISALVLAAAPALSAQTTAAAHHPAASAAHAPTCSVLPPLSPQIPALPAGTPCAKPLYTITRTPDIKLDYVSPLVSPEVREGMGATRTTFSLDYIDVTHGTGEIAKAGKFLQVKYTGYLVNGTKFDSSYDRGPDPISFQYGAHKVIPGWDTGFEGMRVGGKRRLFIPFQLAYGDRATGPIPARSALIFDVELVGEGDAPPAPKPAPARPPIPAPKPGAPVTGSAPGASAAPASTPPATTAAPASTPPSTTTAPKK